MPPQQCQLSELSFRADLIKVCLIPSMDYSLVNDQESKGVLVWTSSWPVWTCAVRYWVHAFSLSKLWTLILVIHTEFYQLMFFHLTEMHI